MFLSRYDREVAAALLAPIAVELEQEKDTAGDRSIEFKALALIDPRRAATLVERLPMTGDLSPNANWVRIQVAETLASPRCAMESDLAFPWQPGWNLVSSGLPMIQEKCMANDERGLRFFSFGHVYADDPKSVRGHAADHMCELLNRMVRVRAPPVSYRRLIRIFRDSTPIRATNPIEVRTKGLGSGTVATPAIPIVNPCQNSVPPTVQLSDVKVPSNWIVPFPSLPPSSLGES